ncbi:hypothetical protein [Photobacterium kishitanii]|uniref:Uncharacterized protein n=1 Tax=Photobacterium kishitanii TaxID=318456 RepID=A0A2T3KL79_9GAMM|nr:hypothetical protein [Photobacterium kishitanii]PSV00462.1 hypothetical protein C9J27_04840 [Photobacterium kishitanii]
MNINKKAVTRKENGTGVEYCYFACSGRVENERFFDNLVTELCCDEDGLGYRANELIYTLLMSGWNVSSIEIKQHATIALTKEDNTDSMQIDCDIIEHGLAVALYIARNN